MFRSLFGKARRGLFKMGGIGSFGLVPVVSKQHAWEHVKESKINYEAHHREWRKMEKGVRWMKDMEPPLVLLGVAGGYWICSRGANSIPWMGRFCIGAFYAFFAHLLVDKQVGVYKHFAERARHDKELWKSYYDEVIVFAESDLLDHDRWMKLQEKYFHTVHNTSWPPKAQVDVVVRDVIPAWKEKYSMERNA